ncbi:hypothetical protein K438DRAFT_1716134 [Mycena galopus ATCC 62051]|nr:hypothetical protein K438DRAFT_1716134 [Mycena galopus ATCC 62051]
MACILPDLFPILRGYASLVSPNRLRFPTHLRTQVIHDFLVEHILLNVHFQKYPPSPEYQKSFWKWIISQLECTDVAQSETEVDARIYELYLELLNSSVIQVLLRMYLFLRLSSVSSARPGVVPGMPGHGPPSQAYITHFWRPDQDNGIPDSIDLDEYQTTTMLESRTMIESGTTGLRTWVASFILAQYLILNPALVRRKRILELGAGVGFLGSVVASLQLLERPSDGSDPGTLWMSDVNDTVLSRCRDNIHLPCNSSSSHPDTNCCFLDWSAVLDPDGTAPLTSLLNEQINADIILGADIVFNPNLIPPLVGVLRLALQANSRPRSALFALTTRNPTTMEKFTDAVRDSGLVLDRLEFRIQESMFMESLECEGDTNNGVNIFRISTKLQ